MHLWLEGWDYEHKPCNFFDSYDNFYNGERSCDAMSD